MCARKHKHWVERFVVGWVTVRKSYLLFVFVLVHVPSYTLFPSYIPSLRSYTSELDPLWCRGFAKRTIFTSQVVSEKHQHRT